MTGISAILPAPSMLPTSENKMRATSNGADFQSHLRAQSMLPVEQPDTNRAQVLSDSTTNLSRRPEMQTMLQLLAWRRNADSASGRPGRSVPGTRASGLDMADFNIPDQSGLTSSEVIKRSCVNGHDRPLYLASFDDLSGCTFNGEESDICFGVIGEGGLNAFAIAVALSPVTLTWVPTEIARAPLRLPGIRTFRRRIRSSAESHFLDRSNSEDGG